MTKVKALDASCRRSWVKPRFSSNQWGMSLVNDYLLACPVPGTSALPAPSSVFSAADDTVASELLDCIKSTITMVAIQSSEREVARWLTNNNKADDLIPRKTEEFICCSVSRPSLLKSAYGLFVDVDAKSITAPMYGPYKNLLCLDAIYRHVRNSLAHGQFRELKRKDPLSGAKTPFLFLQDSSAKQQITARMLLSRRSLEFIADLPRRRTDAH